MDREALSSMAKEAGMVVHDQDQPYMEMLEEFAELVRNDYSSKHASLWLRRIDEAVKAEREACAKICKDADAEIADAEVLAERILARGK
jgi:hypothetical protein